MLFFLRSTFAGGGPAGLIEERTTLAITNLKSEQNTNPTSSPKRQNTPEKLLHPPLRIRIRHRPAPDLLQARIRHIAGRNHIPPANIPRPHHTREAQGIDRSVHPDTLLARNHQVAVREHFND